METSDGLLYGAIISGVFLVFSLISLLKGRASAGYDATVIKKKHYTRESDDDQNTEEEYVTIVRTDDGKKKKIREHGGRTFAYSYLNESEEG